MTFTDEVIAVILNIPAGKIATYGQIAALAGNPRAARQVVRVLHTQSKKHALPWHRVINSHGEIAIQDLAGATEQREKLISEGVAVSPAGKISLSKYQWVGVLPNSATK